MTDWREALVVGGGLAGAALAIELATAGRDVTIVEREAGPHDKVCGEFLSGEALHDLRELGVEPQALGAAKIRSVGVAAGSRLVCRSLPFPALSLSRRQLDEALLARAAAAGARLRRGSGVRSLEAVGDSFVVRLDGGDGIEARAVFVATGKHDLKGWRRPPVRQGDLIGFKQHVRLTRAQACELGERVELFLFAGGYGGLEPIEDGLANLCLLVRKSRFAELGGRWPALLAAITGECGQLRRRLDHAEPIHEKPLAIASIPYGFVRRTASPAWHLGDQAAVIPSFSGDGMSIALHSGRLAARRYLAGSSSAEFQRQLAADVSGQVRFATFLSRLMVSRHASRVLDAGLRVLPFGLGFIARATRLPRKARRRLST